MNVVPLSDADRAGLERLRARFGRPLAELDARDLPLHWQQTDLRLYCRRPRDFDSGPTLGGRIRGALGHALADAATAPADGSAKRRTLWGWPSAFAALYGTTWESGVAPPYAIAAHDVGQVIEIRLALFGFAAIWTNEVKAALARAVARGIAVASEAPVRAPLEILKVEAGPATLRPSASTREALLLLKGLLQIRNEESLRYTPEGFVSSLCNRISALAPWQDFRVRTAHLLKCAEAVSLSFEPPRPFAGMRHSSAQRGRNIPIAGTQGRLMLRGRIEPIVPLLRLGEIAQIGGRTTAGYGHYELAFLP